MDVSAASALNLYTYQTNAQNSSQSSAILQALGQAYAASKPAAGSDPLSALLSANAASPLATAIYTVSAAASATDPTAANTALEGLKGYATYGGLNAQAATTLLGGLAATSTRPGPSNTSGFDAALTATSTLALTAYQQSQTASGPAAATAVNLLG